jgi:hypothetical protein
MHWGIGKKTVRPYDLVSGGGLGGKVMHLHCISAGRHNRRAARRAELGCHATRHASYLLARINHGGRRFNA